MPFLGPLKQLLRWETSPQVHQMKSAQATAIEFLLKYTLTQAPKHLSLNLRGLPIDRRLLRMARDRHCTYVRISTVLQDTCET